MKLSDSLTKPPVRDHVVTACVALIDDEVKHKSGFSGIAVKTAYGVVKAVKPRFVSEVVDGLLDDWVGKLEPFAWGKGAIDQKGRDGIRGQNTWILWGEGNEAFWGWL